MAFSGKKKSTPADAIVAGARKAADFFGGVSRYDSADHPESAPQMARRKDASQKPEKGPFTATPKGGASLNKPAAPKKKASQTNETRTGRY